MKAYAVQDPMTSFPTTYHASYATAKDAAVDLIENNPNDFKEGDILRIREESIPTDAANIIRILNDSGGYAAATRQSWTLQITHITPQPTAPSQIQMAYRITKDISK